MTSKIQGFKRANGSTVHSVTIPKHIIEEAKLKKADEVEFFVNEKGEIVMKKVT